MFDDILEAGARYASGFRDRGLAGVAAKRLAVLTCIDSRIDPLGILGLQPGDAKILRNAGARVTPDALRSLVLAVNLLDVERICIVQHTDCAILGHRNEDLRDRVAEASGVDAGGWDFLAVADPLEALRVDLDTLRRCEFLPGGVQVGGFRFDVRSGGLTLLVEGVVREDGPQ